MFLHVSVILFTGDGGGLSPSMHHSSHDQGGLCPVGVSLQGGLCPVGGGSLSRGVSVQGSLSKGSLFGGVSVWGVSVWGVSVQGVSVRETPCMLTSGQYASYWNAFLFLSMRSRKQSCFTVLTNFTVCPHEN